MPLTFDVLTFNQKIGAQEKIEIMPSQEALSPELAAALEETEVEPEQEVLQALRIDGLFTPTLVLIGLALASIGVTIEAMLLKGLLDIGQQLELIESSHVLRFHKWLIQFLTLVSHPTHHKTRRSSISFHL